MQQLHKNVTAAGAARGGGYICWSKAVYDGAAYQQFVNGHRTEQTHRNYVHGSL